MRRSLSSALLFTLLSLVWIPRSTEATTYVMVADADLARQADVIAVVKVASVELSPQAARLATDVQVEVERAVQGNLPGSSLVIRVPGGVRGNLGLKIWGAPEFKVGDRALVFLNPQSDGSFSIRHLMLGAFFEVPWNGRSVALRNLDDAGELVPSGREKISAEGRRPRDFQRFVDWLQDRAAGRDREPDYFISPEAAPPTKFTFLTSNGFRIRWFEFDRGQSVSWRSNSSGQEGVTGGGHAEFQRVISAWNADGGTNINYAYVGQTTAAGGLDNFDDINAILFNRTLNSPYDCNTGGVLAIGGPWFDPDIRETYRGESYIVAQGGDIATNSGLSCFFLSSVDGSSGAEELFGHELGHTLGLGHACGDAGSGTCTSGVKNDALMRAFIHDDSRGARLSTDDKEAIAVLYTPSGGGGGGGGRPSAPGSFAGRLEGTNAVLTWVDQATNEQGFRVYRGVAGGALTLHATLAANIQTYTDANLAAGTTYAYEVAAFNNRGESNRTARVTLTVPNAQPISITIQAVPPALAGAFVPFQAITSGPVVRAEWEFTSVGRGTSDAACDTGRFCSSFLFTVPGTYTIKVKAVGDVGQTAEDTETVTIGVAGTPLAEADSFLQSVLFGPRGNTGTFKSDLWLHNAGTSDTLVALVYLPRGAGNPNPERREFVLPSGRSEFIQNLVSTLFAETNTQGSLGIELVQPTDGGAPKVFAFGRSYAEVPEGSFGQLVEEEAESTWSNAEKAATGIFEGSGFTTTLLAANLDSIGGRVDVDLFDAQGNAVGASAAFTLGPRTMRFQPLATLFPAITGRTGPFTARFRSTGVRYAASATLLETGSTDQIFIPAAPLPPAEGSLDPNLSEGELIVPRIVRGKGQFNTTLANKLIAWNPTSSVRNLTLSFWRRGQDNSNPPTVTRTLPPNGTLLIDDVVKDLFNLDEDTGALRILWSGPVGLGPRILSLGFANTPATSGVPAKRFGMLVDSRRPIVAGASRSLDFGAEKTNLSRSSYGVINLNNSNATIRLTLRDENGATLGQETMSLKARQHFERTLLGIFPTVPDGSNWHLTTEVIAGSDVLSYLANINSTGDVFYVPGRPLD